MTIEEQKYLHLGGFNFTGILESSKCFSIFKLLWKIIPAKLVSDFLSNRKKLTAGHNLLLVFSKGEKKLLK